MTGAHIFDELDRPEFDGPEPERPRPHRRVRPRPQPLPEVDPRRLPLDHPALAGFEAAGFVRRIRQMTGIGQRELVWRARLSHSTVARAETGALMPSLAVLRRLLAVAALHLVVVTEDGTVVPPLSDYEPGSRPAPPAPRRYAHHRRDSWARRRNPDPMAIPDMAAARPDWDPPTRVGGDSDQQL